MSADEPSFFGSLLDFRFARFVTVDLIRVVYGLQVGILVIATALGDAYLITQIMDDEDHGPAVELAPLILSPVALLLAVLVCRVLCELVMVVFRIAEELRELRRRSG